MFGPVAPQPGVTPTLSNLPRLQIEEVFGREAYVDRLHQAILHGNAAVTQSVRGGGGVGKTTLALHYARHDDVAARFPLRWWVVADSTASLEAGFAELGRAVGEADAQEPDAAAARKAHAWLIAAPREALIVYDNAEAGEVLGPWLPGDAAAALVTTRVKAMAGLPEIDLEVWPPETARDFLLRRTGQTDEEAALDLAGELGGLPLACEQAAAYVNETEETLARYLARFRANPRRMAAKKATGSTQENTIATTFALAIERAAADCAAAPVVLSVMAELAEAPLPLAVFGHDWAPEGLRDEEDAADAVDALVRWALATRAEVEDKIRGAKTPCLDAHRLIRLAAQDQGDAPLARAARALGGAFPRGEQSPAHYVQGWPLCGALAPHAVRLADRVGAGAAAPEETLNFTLALNQASTFFWAARADHTQARRMFEAALKIKEAAFGPDHPEVAITLSDLSIAVRNLGGAGNLAKARAALERALEIDEAALGPDHPNVATHLSNLANVLRNLGGAETLAEARAVLVRALEIDEAAQGPDHPSVAIHLSNLANVLRELGGAENLAEARAALERCWRIKRQQLGEDHATIGITLMGLAHVRLAQGDRAAALDHARRAQGILLAALGPDHGHTGAAARLVAHLEGAVS